MRFSIATKRALFASGFSILFCYFSGTVMASQITSDQLKEADLFIRQELNKIEKDTSLLPQQAQAKRQELISRNTCIQGIKNQNPEIQAMAICKVVKKEVSDGKLQRSFIEKALSMMPAIAVGIVCIVIALSMIKL